MLISYSKINPWSISKRKLSGTNIFGGLGSGVWSGLGSGAWFGVRRPTWFPRPRLPLFLYIIWPESSLHYSHQPKDFIRTQTIIFWQKKSFRIFPYKILFPLRHFLFGLFCWLSSAALTQVRGSDRADLRLHNRSRQALKDVFFANIWCGMISCLHVTPVDRLSKINFSAVLRVRSVLAFSIQLCWRASVRARVLFCGVF